MYLCGTKKKNIPTHQPWLTNAENKSLVLPSSDLPLVIFVQLVQWIASCRRALAHIIFVINFRRILHVLQCSILAFWSTYRSDARGAGNADKTVKVSSLEETSGLRNEEWQSLSIEYKSGRGMLNRSWNKFGAKQRSGRSCLFENAAWFISFVENPRRKIALFQLVFHAMNHSRSRFFAHFSPSRSSICGFFPSFYYSQVTIQRCILRYDTNVSTIHFQHRCIIVFLFYFIFTQWACGISWIESRTQIRGGDRSLSFKFYLVQFSATVHFRIMNLIVRNTSRALLVRRSFQRVHLSMQFTVRKSSPIHSRIVVFQLSWISIAMFRLTVIHGTISNIVK